MTKIYKLILFTLLFPLFLNAQTNYKPGYVVTLKGDTLRGFIDYKEWDKNPAAIQFKVSLNDNLADTYSAKTSAAFGVAGSEYYQRFAVSISQDAIDMNSLPVKPDSIYRNDTVFLKLVTRGKFLTLYNYTDKIKLRLYILETGETQPQELIYHAFFNSGQSASVQFVRRYRTQFENIAQKHEVNTDKLEQLIAVANFRESDIIEIVDAINGTSSLQFKPQKLGGFNFFVGAGINYSSLLFTGAGFEFDGKKGSSTFPKLTAGIDLFGNKAIKKVILRVEYSYTANHFSFAARNTIGPNTTSTLDFKQYTSAITPQIIYNIYNSAKLKMFVGVGASVNLSSYSKHKTVTIFDTNFLPRIVPDYPNFIKTWVSIPIRAGIIMNRNLEVGICYQPSSSILSYNTVSGTITSYQAGINYSFGGK